MKTSPLVCRQEKTRGSKGKGELFDLVQWPVEPAATIHVLSPCPLLLDINGTLLITNYGLTLGGVEATEAH